ncbi:MAG TPA: CHAD domain-containing protein [Planctomycetota bacterium]
MSTHTEKEFKLRALRPLEVASVDAAVREEGLSYRTADPSHHVDTYFDDESGSLARAGIGLRVRENGSGSRVTCKTRGSRDGGLFVRDEYEADWSPQQPPRTADELPPVLRDVVAPFVLDRLLVPVLKLETQRDLRIVQRAEQDLCELAIDHVQATTAGRTAEFCEIEIEVIDDLPGNERLAEVLRRQLVLQPADDDKPTHAALMLGLALCPDAPPTLLETDPVGSAVAVIAAKHLDAFRHAEVGVRSESDPAQLHAMRVATRRLRSLVRAFRDLWTGDDATWLLDHLGATGRQLGALRDLDVMLEDLAAACPEIPAALQPAAAAAVAWIGSQREGVQAELQSWLRSEARRLELGRLEQLLAGARDHTEVATTPVGATVPSRIAKAVTIVRKLADAIGPELPTAKGHELRIAAKRLRYLAEDFTALPNLDCKEALRALADLQQVLGAVCDHELGAQRLLGWIGPASAASPDGTMVAAALGALAARHTMLARKARKAVARCLERTNRKRTWRQFPAVGQANDV